MSLWMSARGKGVDDLVELYLATKVASGVDSFPACDVSHQPQLAAQILAGSSTKMVAWGLSLCVCYRGKLSI